MNLFRKRSSGAERVSTVPLAPAQSNGRPAGEIALSAEQKSLLKNPVDPRVDRILQKIYSDRAAAERALKAQRIIQFPDGRPGQSHVVQDKNGFWHIVPGAPPKGDIGLLGAL